MTANTLFEIFILVDVFFIGVLTVIAFRHAQAHYQPDKQPEPERLPIVPVGDGRLPAAIKQRMLQDSEVKFQAVLNHSADSLQHDLETTAQQIDHMVNNLATQIVTGELESYRTQLAQLQKQAMADMSGIKKAVVGYQEQLEAKIAQELQAEKLRLIKQIDTKLADAVGSFLVETLQHNIDLGSQSPYLIALLEEHKADFKQEVTDDAQPAK
jgi:uncharacterized protein YaaR (DUF327 family)